MAEAFVRIEAVVPAEPADRIVDMIQAEFAPAHHVTVCIESVEVPRPEKFFRRSPDRGFPCGLPRTFAASFWASRAAQAGATVRATTARWKLNPRPGLS